VTLHNGSYDWQFVNDGESSFTDSGKLTTVATDVAGSSATSAVITVTIK
jgi:hypothetical protein